MAPSPRGGADLATCRSMPPARRHGGGREAQGGAGSGPSRLAPPPKRLPGCKEEAEIKAKLATLAADATLSRRPMRSAPVRRASPAPARTPRQAAAHQGHRPGERGQAPRPRHLPFRPDRRMDARGNPLGRHLSRLPRPDRPRGMDGAGESHWRPVGRRPRSDLMLADKDRIFTNIYGFHDKSLKGAMARGHWDGTKGFIDKAATGSSNRSRIRGCAAAAAPASRPASNGRSCRSSRTAVRTTSSSMPTSRSRAPARTARSCATTRTPWSRAA